MEGSKSLFYKKWWFWVILVLVIVLIFIFFLLPSIKEDRGSTSSNRTKSADTYWRQGQTGWEPVGNPPACPEPLVLSIGDFSQATSVLYPGQMRSVGYEPTAGFRFDKAENNQIPVEAPLDGEIVQAARFYERGEIQYVLDIMSPCGIMNRFDHLLELPANLKSLADKLPAPKEGDTRSTSINPPLKVSRGEVVAVEVGSKGNVGLSWTVYDFRHKNKISENESWASSHDGLYHFAICPYQYMTTEDQAIAKKLPAADMTSGNKSDFCNGIWPN